MNFIDDAISYDKSVKLGGLYDDQSVFLNVTRFFDDFRLVSNNDGEWLKNLGFFNQNIPLNTEDVNENKLANTEAFEKLVKAEKGRRYIFYSPLDPPYLVNPLAYIMNSPTIAHAYENKRYFRDEFADLITLPDFEIRKLDEITDDTYKELSIAFGKMVLQDVDLSGAKGTLFAATKEEFDIAVNTLKSISYSGTVVISKFVHGLNRSIQVCVTKYGIFTGGLQKQLVNSEYLCNVKQKGSTKWCGGEVGGLSPDIVTHKAGEIATIVGSELASHGYRGIFGIDLIVTPENEVYAIEVNARLTGYSHILSDMQFQKKKIPFMLLHTLELANIQYEIDDSEAIPLSSSLDETYSYLIVVNEKDGDYELKKDLLSGIYKITHDAIVYDRPGYSVVDLNDNEVIILSKFTKAGDKVGRGKRIYKIIVKGQVIDDATGDLNGYGQELVMKTRKGLSIYKETEP